MKDRDFAHDSGGQRDEPPGNRACSRFGRDGEYEPDPKVVAFRDKDLRHARAALGRLDDVRLDLVSPAPLGDNHQAVRGIASRRAPSATERLPHSLLALSPKP